jgi:hypothetical protein
MLIYKGGCMEYLVFDNCDPQFLKNIAENYCVYLAAKIFTGKPTTQMTCDYIDDNRNGLQFLQFACEYHSTSCFDQGDYKTLFLEDQACIFNNAIEDSQTSLEWILKTKYHVKKDVSKDMALYFQVLFTKRLSYHMEYLNFIINHPLTLVNMGSLLVCRPGRGINGDDIDTVLGSNTILYIVSDPCLTSPPAVCPSAHCKSCTKRSDCYSSKSPPVKCSLIYPDDIPLKTKQLLAPYVLPGPAPSPGPANQQRSDIINGNN